ncbi:MAG: HEAT repeat domain-containing protein [Candidatus Abyssubacteria bacterium]|nr:HEAT repeat domain-containing protein [Candidatus Abyssubacteria bacterium]
MKRSKWIMAALLAVPMVLGMVFAAQSAGKKHQIEDLEYALDNEDPVVRLAAIVELKGYGEAAVPSIGKALGDSDRKVKRAAIKALGDIGGERAVSALAEMRTDPDRIVRALAILALASAGRPAMPHLLEALESEPFPRARMFAAHGITRMARHGDAPAIMERFERQDAATHMHLVAALVTVGDDEAYAGLGRLIQSPNRLVRFYVASTIAESPSNKKALPILIDAMDDEAPEIRMWAMFGLENLNLSQSYPVVLAALDDKDDYVRKEAAYTLGNLGNRNAIPHLISRLEDPHYLVRSDAAESLGKLGAKQAVPALQFLLEEKKEAVQIRTAEALARLDDYSGMEKLIAILDSPNPRYRMKARKALERISNMDLGKDSREWSRWWEQVGKTLETSHAGDGEE